MAEKKSTAMPAAEAAEQSLQDTYERAAKVAEEGEKRDSEAVEAGQYEVVTEAPVQSAPGVKSSDQRHWERYSEAVDGLDFDTEEEGRIPQKGKAANK